MPPQEPDQEDALQLPRRTTPTWDMELLLSGATVFALFQAAQTVAQAGVYYLPRMQGDLLMLTSILFTYAHGGLILLVLTFALHLGLRAYWVALVGIHSVYPAGVRMDRLRVGPLTKDLLARRWRSMDDIIERADNRATVVFGLGVSVVIVLVPVSLVVTLMFGVATLVGWASGHPDATEWAMVGLMLVIFIPYLVATQVDKRRGAKLVPGSFAHRLCSATLSLYSRMGMGRDANPLATVFTSNIGDRRGNIIVFMVMFTAMISSTVALLVDRQDLGLGSYGAFPDPRRGMPASVEGRSYASSHEADWSPATPYIPDMVARGSYVKLVVPYVPMIHGPVLDRCPGAGATSGKAEGERQRRLALLACLDKAVAVTLDGQPVAITPEWYTDPTRDMRGLLYMIPAAALAPGRHELAVMPPPDDEERDEPEQPYVIPFWR